MAPTRPTLTDVARYLPLLVVAVKDKGGANHKEPYLRHEHVRSGDTVTLQVLA